MICTHSGSEKYHAVNLLSVYLEGDTESVLITRDTHRMEGGVCTIIDTLCYVTIVSSVYGTIQEYLCTKPVAS